MASAGGDGREQTVPHITLRAGQGVTLRFVQRPVDPGQPHPPHPSIRLVRLQPIRPPQHVAASRPREGHDVAAAAREQQAAARQRAEEEHRREQLRGRLALTDPPMVDCHDDGNVSLSWYPVEVEEVEYVVCMVEGNKESTVYSGSLTSCTVMHDLLNPGQSYEFRVCASVDGMQGAPSPVCPLTLPALPPHKPLPPKLASRTKNGLVIKWNVPNDNGSPIVLYSLEWDQCGGEYVEVFRDRVKQFRFNHKFQPGAVAHFRLRALNDVGWSEYSDLMQFSAGAGPPSAPSPPTLTHASPHSLTLQWLPPQDNGLPVTSYRLDMDDPTAGYGFCPVYTGDETSFVCQPLSRLTGFTFRLSAANERGSSPFSRPVTFHTLTDVPAPPALPHLMERACPTSLHIGWQHPSDDGGSPVSSYVLEMCDEGAEFMTCYQGPDTATIVKSLSAGRSYVCRVCAVSEGGQSKWSRTAQFRTPATLPSPPLALRITGKTTQMSAVLEWDRPQRDGGSPIISYSLELREAEKDSWRAIGTVAEPMAFTSTPSPLPPPITHTITRLTPGQTYRLRVRCRNSVGDSAWSEECECMTAPGVPEPPMDLHITSLSPSSLELAWKPSVDRGSAVVGYHVEFWMPGRERSLYSTTDTPSLSLSAVMPVSQYHARVKAISAAGHSDWSPPITITTPPSTPSPPSALHIITRSPSTIHIGWDVPNSHGAPVSAYHVEACPSHVTSSSGHVISIPASETQCIVGDLQPQTTYRLRVQAENDVGKGPFTSYLTASTLPPPPSPPLITLTSCTASTLRVAWGKKPVKGVEYVLQMMQEGKRYHVVYRGTDTSHRISRLQPLSQYILRIAALSESGQGEWSDVAIFTTTPSPPPSPTDIVLRQVGTELVASWAPVVFPQPVIYDTQVRQAASRDYQQLYRGDETECSLHITTPCPPTVYEVRVRSLAICSVNGQEEALWSSYCAPVQCVCRLEEELPKEKTAKKVRDERGRMHWLRHLSPRVTGLLGLLIVSFLTLVLSFLLGHYAA